MSKKGELPDYWSAYKAMNFKRFSKSREFIDARSGKTMTYSFVGEEMMRHSVFMNIFCAIMWMSPVFLIFVVSALYLHVAPYSMLIAILFVTGYHFAAMYYLVRGPMTIIEPVKKGIFSRK